MFALSYLAREKSPARKRSTTTADSPVAHVRRRNDMDEAGALGAPFKHVGDHRFLLIIDSHLGHLLL
jgi:hypothetical protein